MIVELERSQTTLATLWVWYKSLWAAHPTLVSIGTLAAWIMIGIHCLGAFRMLVPFRTKAKSFDDVWPAALGILLWPFTLAVVVLCFISYSYEEGDKPNAAIFFRAVRRFLDGLDWLTAGLSKFICMIVTAPFRYAGWVLSGYGRNPAS